MGRPISAMAWIWPEGLVHHVEAHRVRLPDEFIALALALRTPTLHPPPGIAHGEGCGDTSTNRV